MNQKDVLPSCHHDAATVTLVPGWRVWDLAWTTCRDPWGDLIGLFPNLGHLRQRRGADMTRTEGCFQKPFFTEAEEGV